MALQAADFERALRTKPRARTAHFLLHHVPLVDVVMSRLPTSSSDGVVDELSTTPIVADSQVVDISMAVCCLGTVVPKRFVRRAVTRNLIRRQTREAWRACRSDLADGHWIVRLRAAFDRSQFSSAASPVLKRVVREELSHLLDAAIRQRSASQASGA